MKATEVTENGTYYLKQIREGLTIDITVHITVIPHDNTHLMQMNHMGCLYRADECADDVEFTLLKKDE